MGVSSIHYRRLPLNGIFVSSSFHCPSSAPRCAAVISVLRTRSRLYTRAKRDACRHSRNNTAATCTHVIVACICSHLFYFLLTCYYFLISSCQYKSHFLHICVMSTCNRYYNKCGINV